jgi:hypothetical protein
MSKQYTNEELVEKVLDRIQFPDTGRRVAAKKNLMYVRTALGGTFIEIEEGEDSETN